MNVTTLFLVLLACAIAVQATMVEFEAMQEVPAEWTAQPDFPIGGTIQLTLGLRRSNADKLHELFEAVSDPTSPQYGQYLSQREVTALVRPEPALVARVQAWARANGARSMRLSGHDDQLIAVFAVEDAATMLGTDMVAFRHRAGAAYVVRANSAIHVPEEVASDLDYIVGPHSFPLVADRPAKASPMDGESFGPSAIRAAYKVTDMGGASKNNSMAVAEFQGQYYAKSDLESFFRQFVHYAPFHNVSRIVGTNDPSDPGLEATLDIQYIMGVAPKIRTEFWSQAPFDFWSDLTTWVGLIQKDPGAPWVHSVSYGSQGQYPTKAFRTRLNSDFEALAVRGISIIFASGDSGTGCKLCHRFTDSVPSTLPAVTAVGATTFEQGTSGAERAVDAFASGGGFSDFFARPSYQDAAVSAYLKSGVELPPSSYFDAKNRATPDVSALGWGYDIVANGVVSSIGGTSAATPTFSAIVSLLNDRRLAAGKPTLGFLNPWIYQTAAANPNAFTDVTVGSNPSGCCGTGFNCAKGWDPVTGLGTPNFEELLKHI